ncbi:glycosyltransferase [Leucobacter chromiiresistens]|uniref:Glycosyltransferase involved in cell wall bisynthesis n=2 Tax=Leucobacter chromiiresistens TaxID=1079994 RepID=A0A1H0YPM5_9MICO|nr:glycosyltransferase [Leucobacter chromiiresistens]SDQ17144.1 Glycosyltransferase involved in cell wall bisynthesis [Leucobacter chromiiresistens]
MAVAEQVREMLHTGTLTQVMQHEERLAHAAAHDPDGLEALRAAIAGDDQAVAIAAVHAASHVDDERASDVLDAALRDARPFLREHSAWAFARRRPRTAAIPPLVDLVIAGGFGGMIAQRTLEAWGDDAPEAVVAHLSEALRTHTAAPVRRRLTETLGLIRDPRALPHLDRAAHDPSEEAVVRDAARDALDDARHRDARERDARERDAVATAEPGSAADTELTIAQLFLGADIDAGLRTVGSDNNGGIATLLVRLGDALIGDAPSCGGPIGGSIGGGRSDRSGAAPATVGRVLTLSRGADVDCTPAATAAADQPSRHAYAPIHLPVAAASVEDTWSNFVAARRGIARALVEHGPVHAIHLRMADVGTFAAWDVANALGIPVIFTAAPDPHALIESLEHSGVLTRQNFGEHDARDRYWFRARLVRDLARRADHTVLMPRERLRADLQRLVGIEIDDAAQYTPVAEGIDVGVIDAAVDEARAVAQGADPEPLLAELAELLRGLPAHRRGLPLLISVGRLHRVKGMSSIVEAWADPELREHCNLLIVGGNLARPSADEAEQIARIDALVDPAERAAQGLLLVGHRPNETAARWVAAARFGIPGLAAPHGVYVCGSMKEEFGLAILEAMAAGVFVIAPLRGGPATYVESGRTGVLVDTSDVGQLRAAIATGLARAADEPDARAAASRALVSERFSIHTMARTLAGIYRAAHGRRRTAPLSTESDQHA